MNTPTPEDIRLAEEMDEYMSIDLDLAARLIAAHTAPLRELLRDILSYRRGLGKYNFSKLMDDDRSLAAMEAWEEIEARIEAQVKL